MNSPLIVNQEDFEGLCREIEEAGIVGFDTEFVSEFTYRPELCLLQFATPTRCVAVDPYEVQDLTMWWDLMTSEKVTVIVHGGREEVRFCVTATGKEPGIIADVQIAEGLPQSEFSIGIHGAGATCAGEKSERQGDTHGLATEAVDPPAGGVCALEDVTHLLEIWKRQSNELTRRGRMWWAEAEFRRMCSEIADERTRENFRRIPGSQRLSARELGILRELFFWREKEAESKNKPARRMMRDDLLLELAHRQPSNVQELTAPRDMNRTEYRRDAAVILECIVRGQNLPTHELPAVERQQNRDEEQVLGQFLSLALANLCLQEGVAQQLVGTNNDLRQLVRWQVYGDQTSEEPRLMKGWRAEVCGTLLTDLLAGKITLRVADPQSDHPLVFERDTGS